MKAKNVVCAAAAVACMASQGAFAVPVTFDFSGTVINATGATGAAVGDALTGYFSYDTDLYAFGNAVLSATAGSFSRTDAAYLVLSNGSVDSQWVASTTNRTPDGNNPLQFQLFSYDPSGTALSSDTTVPGDMNFDFAAWREMDLEFNIFNPNGIGLVEGFTARLSSLAPRQAAAVPEPAAFGLLTMALGALAFRRKKMLS